MICSLSIAPDDVNTERPSSSQRAWKAPMVQQDTRGTLHPDQRPLSSGELAEASAYRSNADADSQSKAERDSPSKPRRIRRPLTSQESNWLSEVPVEVSAGTPVSPDERDGKTTVFRCEAPMHKTWHWPVYPRQVRIGTLEARPPAGGTAHNR